MKAYEVDRGTKVRLLDEELKVPPAAPALKQGDVITIERLDGMYCNCHDENGIRVYIAAWSEVEIVED